jgi:hypothetical protein
MAAVCIPSQKTAFCPSFIHTEADYPKIAVSKMYNLKQIIMKKTWILLTACALIVVGLILNFTIGNQFSAGDYSFNYFAAGDFACGVFAAGKFSIGIFSIGIFSIGIFSVSIFNIGLYTIGIFVLGWKKALPWWLEHGKQA